MAVIATDVNLSTRILIVDDDAGIRELISGFLAKHGFQVDVAADPPQMRERLAGGHYDLIVLDVMMPGEDGLTALKALQRDGGPPVIMLSAVGSDVDRIVGLEIGAEDYLAKPCNPRELLARIRTVLRRAGREAGAALADAPASGGLHFAGWHLSPTERLLYDPQQRPLSLSDGEFRLLRSFAEHPRRVLTRDQLMDYALGSDSQSYDRAIDVQISRLRRKLAEVPGGDELIRTVRNEGYLFVPAVTRE